MKTALILGAGAAGCAAAHQLAIAGGWEVIVVESAPFTGAGIRTAWYAGHPYTFGPRHFLTRNEAVWNYMNQYCPLRSCADHEFKTFVASDSAFYNFPIHEVDIVSMPECLCILHELQQCEYELSANNLEEYWIASVGPTLYNKMVRGYNAKMWQMDPKNLDTFNWSPKGATLKSGPRAAWDGALSGYPLVPNGYDYWIDLCLSKAEVHLSTRMWNFDWDKMEFNVGDEKIRADIFINTAPVDMLTIEAHEMLPYIGRDFYKFVLPVEFALPEHVYFIYESGTEAWTRITEYKKFTRHESPHTLLSMEIPSNRGRHYPIPTLAAQAQARKYIEALPRNVYSIGRHGTYRYGVDIAACIEMAQAMMKRINGGWDHPVPLERFR